jgi:site-specific recombinase XerD
MQLSRAVAEYIRAIQVEQKSKETINGYRSDLNKLAALAARDSILRLSAEAITRFFENGSLDGNKPSTLHRKAASVREFVRWGGEQGFWDPNPLLKAVPRIRRPETLPRPFTREEIARLWKLELPHEERVLRALLFFTGLRIGAIARMLVGDISEDPPTIRTITKGSKPVLKHLHPTLASELFGYLRGFERKGRPQDFLFRTRKGKMVGRREMEEITHRWGALAQVRDCTPHRFRHVFATSLLEEGVDIRVIQLAMDHRDIKSTAIYTKVHDEQVRAAMLKLPASWGGE